MRKSVKLKEIDRVLQENRELKNKNRKLSRNNAALMEENARLREVLYVFTKSNFKDPFLPGYYFYEVTNSEK